MAVISATELGTQAAVLDVEREGIRFSNVAPDRVRIEVVVHNRGTVRSQATPMVVQSAPLGAFLPWRPLGRLMVPPVDPGSWVQLQLDVDRTPSAPLGEFSRVPPSRLLTALDAGDADDADAGNRPIAPLGGRFQGMLSPPRARTIGSLAGVLAPNIFELLDHCTLRWAGNINVFIGQRSVERHMASALRVYPGKTNLAFFCVGTKWDAYSFELEGVPLAEYASFVDRTGMGSLLYGAHGGQPIPVGEWLEASGPLMVALLLRPPLSCQQGDLSVHVRQRSTGREASVEFSLDARAAGPGCFVA